MMAGKMFKSAFALGSAIAAAVGVISALPAAAAVGPQFTACPSGNLCYYLDTQFGRLAETEGGGDYAGVKYNDAYSSLRNNSNYYWMVYPDAKEGGTPLCIYPHIAVSNLGTYNFDNKISSEGANFSCNNGSITVSSSS